MSSVDWQIITVLVEGKELSFEVPKNLSNEASQVINDNASTSFLGEGDWHTAIALLWDYGGGRFSHVKTSNKLVVGLGRLSTPLASQTDQVESLQELARKVWQTRREKTRRLNEKPSLPGLPSYSEPTEYSYQIRRFGEAPFLYFESQIRRELIGIIDSSHYLVIRVDTSIYEVGDWQLEASQAADRIMNSVRFGKLMSKPWTPTN